MNKVQFTFEVGRAQVALAAESTVQGSDPRPAPLVTLGSAFLSRRARILRCGSSDRIWLGPDGDARGLVPGCCLPRFCMEGLTSRPLPTHRPADPTSSWLRLTHGSAMRPANIPEPSSCGRAL